MDQCKILLIVKELGDAERQELQPASLLLDNDVYAHVKIYREVADAIA